MEGELTIRSAGRTAYARKYRSGDGWGISIMQGPKRIGRAKPSNLDEAVAFIQTNLEAEPSLDLPMELAPETSLTADIDHAPSLDSPNVGYVYVLVNPSIPDQVKVGFTSRTPQERCERFQTTGVRNPLKSLFNVFWLPPGEEVMPYWSGKG